MSTIQISDSLKDKLSKLKKTNNESYEDVINDLLKEYSNKIASKKELEERLIKGYKESAEFDLQICREMEGLDRDKDVDWEW